MIRLAAIIAVLGGLAALTSLPWSDSRSGRPDASDLKPAIDTTDKYQRELFHGVASLTVDADSFIRDHESELREILKRPGIRIAIATGASPDEREELVGLMEAQISTYSETQCGYLRDIRAQSSRNDRPRVRELQRLLIEGASPVNDSLYRRSIYLGGRALFRYLSGDTAASEPLLADTVVLDAALDLMSDSELAVMRRVRDSSTPAIDFCRSTLGQLRSNMRLPKGSAIRKAAFTRLLSDSM